MSTSGIVLALMLPTAFGTLAWQAILGRPRSLAAWCANLGAGYVLGVLLLGTLMAAWPSMSAQRAFAQFAGVILVGIVLLGAVVFVRRRDVVEVPVAAPLPPWQRAIVTAVIALVIAQFFVIASQAVALPSLAWDAWNAWLAKSKAWYFADAFVPVVGFDAWLAAPAGEAITTTAPSYPGALPRAMVWMASASGGWHEGAIHVLWPTLWLALGAALFGYARMIGIGIFAATLTAAAVITLPLVTAHASLAGYADLWLASGVLFAGVHLLRAFEARAQHAQAWRRNAIAAALWLLLLPAIKLEGVVWLACALGAIAVSLLPRRWRWAAVGALVIAWASGLPFGGWPVPLPGVGTLRWGWGQIEVGVFGTMALTWRPVGEQVLQSLFLLPNWNLLWYVAPLIVAARWSAIAGTALGVIGWWLLFGYGFLFLLFFFTDASVWAENLTSLNRVLMHVVPLTVFWLSALWARPSPARTTPTTSP